METGKIERMDALLAGELREDSMRLVGTEIHGDTALLGEFVSQARMDAALKSLMADEQEVGKFAGAVMARVQTGGERSLTKSVLTEILEEREAAKRHWPRVFDWWVWTKTAAIAAVAAAATVWVLQSVRLDDTGRVAPKPAFPARLTVEEGVQWAEHSLRAREDGWLGAGRLDLKSGLAEVTFGSGARVLLEGPAVFDIEQTNRGFLKRGRLTAEVPKSAIGFVINTPTMNVVDLGTRFGLSTESGGESEVHVMQGVVEVSRARGPSVPVVLREGLAVAADRRSQGRLKPVVYAGHRFVLAAEKDDSLEMGHYLHYSFDESSGADIGDSGVGMDGGPFDASLLSAESQSSRNSPKRTAGMVGRGLAFGPGDRLESRGPSWLAGGTQPWTVAFWVKVPPKASKTPEREIVAWGQGKRNWRIRWNSDADAGVEGALRADYGAGYAIGTHDLRDGRWHHVALVFIGAELGRGGGSAPGPAVSPGGESSPADVATHMRLYIDGKLESLSGGRSERIHPQSSTGKEELASFALGGSGSFEGWLDEFYLLETAASPTTLFNLYERGTSLVDGESKNGAVEIGQ